MDEKNLPSSSDESDADFVPNEEEEEANSGSGSDVSDCDISEGENNSNINRKRKKKLKKYGKKAKANKNEDKEEDNVEEKKPDIDVDALWADFKKDVNNLEGKRTAESSQLSSKKETENLVNESSEASVKKNPLNTKSKGTFNLSNNKKIGGLSKVLNQIGKKDKMSTLQKSQLDWNNFKKNEGIEEEIKMYNRGKDGYLDKQDFLQRTDLRQFEIEKDLRSARRKF